jgi:hypothetical protein
MIRHLLGVAASADPSLHDNPRYREATAALGEVQQERVKHGAQAICAILLTSGAGCINGAPSLPDSSTWLRSPNCRGSSFDSSHLVFSSCTRSAATAAFGFSPLLAASEAPAAPNSQGC